MGGPDLAVWSDLLHEAASSGADAREHVAERAGRADPGRAGMGPARQRSDSGGKIGCVEFQVGVVIRESGHDRCAVRPVDQYRVKFAHAVKRHFTGGVQAGAILNVGQSLANCLEKHRPISTPESSSHSPDSVVSTTIFLATTSTSPPARASTARARCGWRWARA